MADRARPHFLGRSPAKAGGQNPRRCRSPLCAPAFAGAPSRKRSGGFTLIEMMVALAVFSLAAMALIRLEGATIRSTGILDDTLVAEMVARNVAVETITDARPPVTGATRGTETDAGRTWTWTRQSAPLGDQGVMKVDIAVSKDGGRPIGHLTVFRPPAPPAAPATPAGAT